MGAACSTTSSPEGTPVESLKIDHPLLEPNPQGNLRIMVYQEQFMKIPKSWRDFLPVKPTACAKPWAKDSGRDHQDETDLHGRLQTKGIEHKTPRGFRTDGAFRGYGFNKSHASAMGFCPIRRILKSQFFPHEYMACLISSAIGQTSIGNGRGQQDRQYIDDAASFGITVVPPDVQSCG